MTVPTPGPPRPSDPRTAAPGSPARAAEPAVPGSGEAADVVVGRAMAGLRGLADRPLSAHVAAFETVHTALGDALSAGSA